MKSPDVTALRECLHELSPIQPEQLERSHLMRRVEHKMLLHQSQLVEFLSMARAHYGVLMANGEPLARYRSRYFDTAELRAFHDHRRGRRTRFKVRIRHYIDRSLSYLEIKAKTAANITQKRREPRRYGNEQLTSEDRDLILEATHWPQQELVPTSQTAFRRITLVGLHRPERITIDTELTLGNGVLHRELAHTVIVEVKLPPGTQRTPSLDALRHLGARPGSTSKYCMSLLLTNGSLPRGEFVMTLKRIAEIERW